ncbi:MAG TPA: hypothetical protein VFV97_03045 [Rhodanobacteraceae bacterium]|nr:hypothetical protein [Rhodanobacteraceae bacterium]
MNNSLSSLYRRLTATAPAPATDDVGEQLAAASAGSKIAAMLRELRTDSEALAFGIARVQRDTAKQTAPVRRHASVMRWTAAMAASLVAAIGVFAIRQQHTTPAMPAAHTVARADEIFSDREMTRPKAPAKGDELFRGSFNG